MKIYDIHLTTEETEAVKDTITNDLSLSLDSRIRSAYEAILSGASDTGFSFTLDFDPVGLEIMQTFLVYTDRIWYMAKEEDTASGLFHFAMQMMPAWTGKTEDDF